MDLRKLDARAPALSRGEIAVIACVRDETLRLPCFLQHHRSLGASRFFIVDNGSTDGTTELLLAQDDVHVFWTEASYAASTCGIDWINELGARYGAGHWMLTADADELFVYPHYERVGLPALARYLDGRGAEAMAGIMLDMYAKSTIAATRYAPGESLLESCPYFDGDSYSNRTPTIQNLPECGGARSRLFRYDGPRQGPLLGKVPFARWREGVAYDRSIHFLPGNKQAEITGVLLHFKFLADFRPRAELESRRGEHWKDATWYKGYSQALQDNPELTPYYEGSVRFRNSAQLVELGLARSSEEYEQFFRAALPPAHRRTTP